MAIYRTGTITEPETEEEWRELYGDGAVPQDDGPAGPCGDILCDWTPRKGCRACRTPGEERE